MNLANKKALIYILPCLFTRRFNLQGGYVANTTVRHESARHGCTACPQNATCTRFFLQTIFSWPDPWLENTLKLICPSSSATSLQGYALYSPSEDQTGTATWKSVECPYHVACPAYSLQFNSEHYSCKVCCSLSSCHCKHCFTLMCVGRLEESTPWVYSV